MSVCMRSGLTLSLTCVLAPASSSPWESVEDIENRDCPGPRVGRATEAFRRAATAAAEETVMMEWRTWRSWFWVSSLPSWMQEKSFATTTDSADLSPMGEISPREMIVWTDSRAFS